MPSRRIVFDDLMANLSRAMKDRPKLTKMLDGEFQWIDFERRVMHSAVNDHRCRIGKSLVSIAAIKRAETSAMGHCDYARKFALYCAELVEAD